MRSDRYSRRCREHFRNALNVPSDQTPLWLLEPSSTLPKVYRRQGIAVGDIGIITASGGFDFLFNVHRHTEFRPNSHLASASVHTLESPPALCRTHRLAKSIDSSADIYLDTYIPASNQWEQHTISSVRLVDRQQQLLYKVWQSLVEGLSESKCCSLHDELELQHWGARFHPSPSNDTQSPLRLTSTASASSLSKAINEGEGFLTRPEAPQRNKRIQGAAPKSTTAPAPWSPVQLSSLVPHLSVVLNQPKPHLILTTHCQITSWHHQHQHRRCPTIHILHSNAGRTTTPYANFRRGSTSWIWRTHK